MSVFDARTAEFPTSGKPARPPRPRPEVFLRDHPLVLCAAYFVCLVGFAAGCMFSLIFGLGVIGMILGLIPFEEGPMFVAMLVVYFLLSAGMARYSLKLAGFLAEVTGTGTDPVAPIKAIGVPISAIWDRDLDEAPWA